MFKELKLKLDRYKIENELLTEILEKSRDPKQSDGINIGNRVQILYENGLVQEGRVVGLNSERTKWLVNRDGYAATIGIPKDQLKKIYTGIEEEIDLRIWNNMEQIRDIERALANSNLPDYFLDKEYVNIKIIARSLYHKYATIECQIFNHNPVYRIKIPRGSADNCIYLQLHVCNGDIVNVHQISEKRWKGEE